MHMADALISPEVGGVKWAAHFSDIKGMTISIVAITDHGIVNCA